MIATPSQLSAPTRLRDVDDRPAAWLLALGVAVDAWAVAFLLGGTSHGPMVSAFAATSLHAAAVLMVLVAARTRPSRRWLALAAGLCVPFAGAAVAIVATVTRGRGRIARPRRRIARLRPGVALAEARRVREALPLWDALTADDHEQRRAALITLSRRNDAEAIAMLRRTAAAPDPDLALSSALALDEISRRGERRWVARNGGIVRDAAG